MPQIKRRCSDRLGSGKAARRNRCQAASRSQPVSSSASCSRVSARCGSHALVNTRYGFASIKLRCCFSQVMGPSVSMCRCVARSIWLDLGRAAMRRSSRSSHPAHLRRGTEVARLAGFPGGCTGTATGRGDQHRPHRSRRHAAGVDRHLIRADGDHEPTPAWPCSCNPGPPPCPCIPSRRALSDRTFTPLLRGRGAHQAIRAPCSAPPAASRFRQDAD